MEKKNLNVWFDEWEMKVGDSLNRKVQEGIKESSYLAIIISPQSIRSQWVERELNAAYMKELELKEIFILPIYYKDCEIPLFLRDKLYADFRNNFRKGLAELFKRFD